MRRLSLLLLTVCFAAVVNAQVTVTNPGNTTPGLNPTYPDLASAITALNAQTAISGPVVITLDPANPQTAPAGGYAITAILAGASATNTVTLEGSANTLTASPALTVGALNDAIFKIIGSDWVTIQNFTMQENAANTANTPASNNMTEFGVALFYGTITDGAQNNTIQNNTISLNRTYLNAIGIYSNTRASATAVTTVAAATTAAGSNSNNKVYGNNISNVNVGIWFIGSGIAGAFDEGNDIGGGSAPTGNTISNWGNASVASGYPSATSSVYCIYMNQQNNDRVSFNTITSASTSIATSQLGGVLKAYTILAPSTATTTNINNNTVTLTNTGATTSQMTGLTAQGMTSLASATININNNNLINCSATGASMTTGSFVGILGTCAPGTLNINGNTIRGTTVGSTGAGSFLGIQQQTNGVINTLNINNNKLGDAVAGAVNYSAGVVTAATFTGLSITSTGAASTCAISISNNDFRGITFTTSGTGAQTYIINGASALSQNISSNTFTNLNVNTTGNVTFISNSISAGAAGFKTINNNSIVTAFNKAGAGGTVALYVDGGSSTSTTAVQNNNNNFSNITVTGATTIAGWSNTDGTGSTPPKQITGNTFSNWTGGTSSITALASSFGGTSTISNNTITNITGQGSITGLSAGSSGTIATLTIANNSITGLSSTGTGGAVTGISNASPATTTNINANTINTFSSSSTTATVVGITTSASSNIFSNVINALSCVGTTSGVTNGIMVTGGTTVNVYKNKIYDLSTTGAFTTAPGVNGIVLSGTATAATRNVYNNLVGDLKAPASTSADAIRGISVTATGTTSTFNVYYNTVYMNATGGATFGTSGIFHAASTTATTAALNLRNNIIYNTSTPAGAGLTVAFRRSAGAAGNLANYASTSNNNDFYAGTPSASNLIYTDGTSSAQTIAAYKAGAFTAGTIAPRDAASISEDPEFQSTSGASADFLKYKVSSSKQIESGAVNIATYTDDYAATIRQGNPGYAGTGTAPDIGAWELEGIGLDLVGPAISYTALGNTSCTTDRTLSSTITDASGVNTTSGTKPRLYYKKSTEADTYAGNTSADNGWKYVEATNASSPFSFTTDYSLLTSPIAIGDSISYFVVAQDLAGTPNIGINSGAFAAAPTSVALTAGAFPLGGTVNGYRITTPGLSGTVYVGPSETYHSLTETGAAGLFNVINTGGLSGNLTVLIRNGSITETGATALNAVNYSGCAAGPFTITIAPDAGATSTLTGSLASAALIKLNGADYVTIDGSNNGTNSRDLTITNTATTAPTAIGLASLGTGLGATNNTIKNCNINTGVATTTGYGIAVGGSAPGSSGADNDNTTIQNNNITVATIGIYAIGTASVSTGGNDNLSITGNTVNTNTTLATIGIQVGNSLNSSISQNTVSVETSTSSQPVAISLETGFVSSSVTRNNITKALATNTGGYGGRGITIGTGTASSNLTVANNMIAGVNGSNWSAFSNSSSIGIAIGIVGTSTTVSTTAGGINLYYNSVSMTGSMGSGSTTALTAALYVGSGASALDIRNNIFSNTQVGTSATQKNYAIYSAVANAAYGTINYNDYYVTNTFNGPSAIPGFIGSDRVDLAAIIAGFGQNANSITGNPQFISASDLHISTSLTTPVESAGISIGGITTDFDGDTRSGTPDIGADEGTFIAPVGNDVQATAFIDPINGGGKVTGATFTPTASFTNNGTINQTNVPVRFKIIGPSPSTAVVYEQTGSIATLNTLVTSNFAFPNTSIAVPGTYTMQAIAELVGDAVPANDMITGTFTVESPLCGTYLVGASQPAGFQNLTQAIAKLNSLGVTCAVTFELQSDYSSAGETFPLTITQYPGISAVNTFTLKPGASVSPVISGSSATSIFILDGVDYMTIDGSNSGGATRDMIIRNTNTSGQTIRFINDATYNTVTNAIVEGATSSTTSGMILFSTAATGTSGNSNNTINKCDLRDRSDAAGVPANAVYSSGTTAAPNANNTISNNNIFNHTNAGVLVTGTGVGNNWTVSGNSIYQTAARTAALTGISIQGATNGHSISDNFIGGSAANAGGANLSTSSTFRGIDLTVGTTTPTSVQGNTVRNIRSTSTAFAASYGIYLQAGNANIGNVTGNTIGSANVAERFEVNGDSYGIRVASTGSVNLANNVINNMTTGPAVPDGEYYWGISVEGTGGVHTITNNTVTNFTNGSKADVPGTFNSQTIGMLVSATGIQTISGNTISDMGNTSTATTSSTTYVNRIWGLIVSGTTAGTIVEKNIVRNIYGSSPNTGGSSDVISCVQSQSTASATFRNNMVATSGGAAGSRAIFGILDLSAAPSVSNYYYNSVNITGTSTSTVSSYAFNRNSTATVDIRNNIFSNERTGGTGYHVAIANTNAAATGWAAGAANYNDLYSASPATLGQWLGSALANNRDFAGWQASQAAGTPGSGGDANSWNVLPGFTSATDLHIPAATAGPLESGGTAIAGITTDIDNDVRPGPAGSVNGGGTAPDIGADEFDGTPASPMTYVSSTTTQANTSNVGNGTTHNQVIGIQVVTSGSLSPLSATSFVLNTNGTTAPGTDISNAKIWYTGTSSTFATGTQFGTTFAAPNGAFTITGTQTLAAGTNYFWLTYDVPCTAVLSNVIDAECNTVTIGIDRTPTVQAPAGSRTIVAGGLNGTVTIGAAGTYPTLTGPGGLFAAINSNGLNGNLTANIIDATITETGAVALNQVSTGCAAGPFNITIKPDAGITTTLSGSVATSLIKLNGADYVTIDGSNNGSSSRNMTLTNTGTGSVVWIGTDASAGATNNTLKNFNMVGPGSFSGQGIIAGSGTTFGAAAENGRPNSNNTVQNLTAKGVQNAIFAIGDATTNDQNWLITQNEFGSAVAAEKLSFRGIALQNVQNFTISRNRIFGVSSSTSSTSTMCGILVGATLTGGTIERNEIFDIKQNNTGGWGSNGIFLNATSTAANVNVQNNLIYDVASYGYDDITVTDNGYGILVNQGGGYNIRFNSVRLTTNQTSASGRTAAINITSGVTTAASLDIRDNIFANTQTVGNRYAIICEAPNTVFANINYNDYFSAGAVGFDGGLYADIATLAGWQTYSAQDLNSVAVDPLYTSATNLNLLATSPLIGIGTTIAGVTNDYSNSTRNSPPSIGAYEDKVVFATKLYLQGAYSAGLGRHRDNTAQWTTATNAAALSQPYSAAPFSYAGTESVASGFFANTAGNDPMDWILLELRDAATPTTVIARRAAILFEDGSVTDVDGVSAVSFKGVNAGNYFVVIRHRNHLGVRSGTTQTIDGNAGVPVSYDFTTAQSQALQDGAIATNAAMAQNGSVFMLWMGNVNQDGYVRATTRSIPLPVIPGDGPAVLPLLGGDPNATGGYTPGDVNLDGYTRATTRSIPLPVITGDPSLILSIPLGGSNNATRQEHRVNN